MTDHTDRQDDVDPEAYNAIVARAVVRGIRMIKSDFNMKPDALGTDKERRYSVDVEQTAHDWDEAQGRLAGVFRFTATCHAGRTRVLKVQGDYIVSYRVEGTCAADAAELFVQRLGPFAAYPYFRALFGILCSHAGLMAPPLPILAEAPRRIARAAKLEMRTTSPLLDYERDGSGGAGDA